MATCEVRSAWMIFIFVFMGTSGGPVSACEFDG
jgi:hypothetical protein